MTNDESKIESMITQKGLNAPRLTPTHIDSIIKSVDYHVFKGTTMTVCCITLLNGAQVIGESACASPSNFDEQIGKERAYERARAKIWELEGYLLCQKLFEKVTPISTVSDTLKIVNVGA